MTRQETPQAHIRVNTLQQTGENNHPKTIDHHQSVAKPPMHYINP